MNNKNYIILFLGAPGSGKTTYANTLYDFFIFLKKKVVYVDLDCSNTTRRKINSIDFKDILIGEEILPELHIGPNSSIFFSIEYLQKNLGWLEFEIFNLQAESTYFFLDFPGQIELFTHHWGIRDIIRTLKKNGFFLSSFLLSDSFFWYDRTNFHILALSNLMMILNTETSFFHILTKTDLVKNLNLFKKKMEKKSNKIFSRKDRTIFSWSDKLRYSVEDILLDFGIINPIPINLNENIQLLTLKRHLEQY